MIPFKKGDQLSLVQPNSFLLQLHFQGSLAVCGLVKQNIAGRGRSNQVKLIHLNSTSTADGIVVGIMADTMQAAVARPQLLVRTRNNGNALSCCSSTAEKTGNKRPNPFKYKLITHD